VGVSAVIDPGWIAAAGVVVLAGVVITAMGIRQRRAWPTDLAPTHRRGVARGAPEVVHVLAPGEVPAARAPAAPPRIDPDRPYVFGDTMVTESPATRVRTLRHDTDWALRHASRRRQMPRGSVRVLIVAALALIVLALIGASLQHGPAHHPPPTHHTGALGTR
jgi:hypothetical protein